MTRVLRQLGMYLVTLWLGTVLAFSLGLFIPGDPARALAGQDASLKQVSKIREQLGLDHSVLVQYFDWLGNALHGDLGRSLITGQTVTSWLSSNLPVTLQLDALALVFMVVLGGALGIAAALRPHKLTDRVINVLSGMLVSAPDFWLGMLLILLLSVKLRWLPSVGFESLSSGPLEFLRYSFMPALALSAVGIGQIARHLRSSMLQQFQQEYVVYARARGLSEAAIAFWHVLRAAAVPVVTILGVLVSRLIGASVVVETLFNIPGAGAAAVQAADNKDLPVLQGLMLVLIVFVILVNAVVESLYGLLDRRIRAGART
jgi:peptide/nickel transport system permease protein